MEDKAVRRYLVRLRRALVCPSGARARLLSRGKELLERFTEENPEARYDDLTEAFGQPEELAEGMLEQLDPAETVRARRRRTYIRRGGVAALVVILVLISAFWYSQYKKSQSWNENAIVVIEPARPMTDEELEQFLEEQGINP